MTRVIRGMTGLLLVATVAACNNDPGVDLSGDPTQIQATPQVMIINQGATEQLLLRLTDDASFSVPAAPYTISDVGPGLTVTFDDTYRPDYTTGVLTPREFQSQHRYTVTASQAVGTTFKVANGGISQIIQVKVIPSSIPAALGAAAVTPGQSTTVTAGSGFTFGAEASFTWNAGGTLEIPALVLSRAADGSSATIVPPSGANGTPAIAGAVAGYLPTIALAALPGTESLTQTQVFTDDYQDGPTVAVAATGATYLVTGGAFGGSDIAGFGGSLKWVRLNWPGGTKTVTMSWTDTGGDIDWGMFDSGGANVAYKGTGANPEVLSVTLPAGVYDLAIADFGNHGPQPQLSIVIE